MKEEKLEKKSIKELKLLAEQNKIDIKGCIEKKDIIDRIKNIEIKEISLRSHFECSLCLDIFYDPVTISCGHTFCRTCLVKSL